MLSMINKYWPVIAMLAGHEAERPEIGSSRYHRAILSCARRATSDGDVARSLVDDLQSAWPAEMPRRLAASQALQSAVEALA